MISIANYRSVALAALCCLALAGCGTLFSNREVTVSSVSGSHLRDYFRNELFNQDGLSLDTANFLRSNLLEDDLDSDPEMVLRKLDEYYALSREAKYLESAADLCRCLAREKSREESLPFHLSALHYCRLASLARLHSRSGRGEAAMQDVSSIRLMLIYNEAVCSLFDYLKAGDLLNHDSFSLTGLNGRRYDFKRPEYRLGMPLEEVEDFSLCSAYEVKSLLHNNRRPGLGVPLVGTLKGKDYSEILRTPRGLTFPATLLVKLTKGEGDDYNVQFLFQDTSRQETVQLGGGAMPVGVWPLALDYSTPLACFLDQLPEKNLLLTVFNPDTEEENSGLFMVEPYQPDKIPVIFVHGLMSSPGTWVQMINSLKNDGEIRKRYQFWFYLYSSGAPVIENASALRRALLEAQKEFCTTDVARASFEKTVILGHSMGGLITRALLQKDQEYLAERLTGGLWQEIRANLKPGEKEEFEAVLLQPPLPFVHRAVFLAVPHRGAEMAQWYFARFASGIITLPASLIVRSAKLAELIQALGREQSSLERMRNQFDTGIDNLDPDSSFIAAIQDSPFKDDLIYHSIMGNKEQEGLPGGGDGIVPYSSSHLDGAASELIVKSSHSVHRTPGAIREVLRILLENLGEE